MLIRFLQWALLQFEIFGYEKWPARIHIARLVDGKEVIEFATCF